MLHDGKGSYLKKKGLFKLPYFIFTHFVTGGNKNGPVFHDVYFHSCFVRVLVRTKLVL